MLDDLGSVATVDRRRIYATGFSNGGQFAYYMACQMGDEIAAISSSGGAMQPPFEACHPKRPMSVLHWAGLADIYDPPNGGQSAIKTAPIQPPVREGIDFWKKFDGTTRDTPVDLVGPAANCTESSGGREKTVVILCLVPGMGHHWPGSNPKHGDPRIIALLGPLGPPMDANDVILKFFSEYALPRR